MLRNPKWLLWMGILGSCWVEFAPSSLSDTYQNPLSPEYEEGVQNGGVTPTGYRAYWTIGDPCVFKWMGEYYLYPSKAFDTDATTTQPYVSAKLQAWSSSDLVDWSWHQVVEDSWVRYEACAPDVFFYNGQFYMYVSENQHLQNGTERHYVMRAMTPAGPFEIVNGNLNGSFYDGIDGSVFMDKDANMTMYFFSAAWAGINRRTLSSPDTLPDPTPAPTLMTSCAVHADPGGAWTEGPQVFMIGDTYYMNYCGNLLYEFTYQVHAARGTSVVGLSAQGNNPIIANIDRGLYRATGHNYVILGPDLQTYYTAYHAVDTTETPEPTLDNIHRTLMVDRAYLDENGNFCVAGPTDTPQPVPRRPDWEDYFPVDHWTGEGGMASWWSDRGNDWITTTGLIYRWIPGMGYYYDWPCEYWCWARGDKSGTTDVCYQIADFALSGDFASEFNLRRVADGEESEEAMMYGVVVNYDPANGGSGFYVLMDTEVEPGEGEERQDNNRLASYAVVNGIPVGGSYGWVYSQTLREDWDHHCWDTLRIEKRGTEYRVYIHDLCLITRTVAGLDRGKPGSFLSNIVADFGYTAVAFLRSPLMTIKDASQDNILWFSNRGELFIRGSIYTGRSNLTATSSDPWAVRNSSGQVVAKFGGEDGDELFLRGNLIQDVNESTSMSTGITVPTGSPFVLKNKEGGNVMYVDGSGNMGIRWRTRSNP